MTIRRKTVAIAFALLLAGGLLAAQEYKGKGRLMGFVYDEAGAPLEGATVKLFSLRANIGFETQTDKEGKWVAAWIRGGGWNIDFEKVGYMPKKISVDVAEYSRNPEITINLAKVEGMVITDAVKDLLIKGNQLFEAEQYAEAEAVYNEILAQSPDAYIIWRNIGNCYFAREDYVKAEEYYLKVLEKDPRNADVILLIGNSYANRGEADKALEWYGKIEFAKIEDPIVLYNIGTSLYNQSRFEDALRYYGRAVEIQNEFTDAIYQTGLANLALGKNEDAVAAFERYLAVDADSERAGQVRGFLDYLKKK
ncbi:MAG: tetratricopeptide repeat protein [Candidatus Aminicenantes bacterium]|nr:tetratricopeptide repeat protein [Candidatus Aminicenantes bacterium]